MSIDRNIQFNLTRSEEEKAAVMGPAEPVGVILPDDGPVEAAVIDKPNFELKVVATGMVYGKVTFATWPGKRLELNAKILTRLVCNKTSVGLVACLLVEL